MWNAIFVHVAQTTQTRTVRPWSKRQWQPNRLAIILSCEDVDAAKAAVEAIKDTKPILDGANAENYAAMSERCQGGRRGAGPLQGANLEELYDTVEDAGRGLATRTWSSTLPLLLRSRLWPTRWKSAAPL